MKNKKLIVLFSFFIVVLNGCTAVDSIPKAQDVSLTQQPVISQSDTFQKKQMCATYLENEKKRVLFNENGATSDSTTNQSFDEIFYSNKLNTCVSKWDVTDFMCGKEKDCQFDSHEFAYYDVLADKLLKEVAIMGNFYTLQPKDIMDGPIEKAQQYEKQLDLI